MSYGSVFHTAHSIHTGCTKTATFQIFVQVHVLPLVLRGCHFPLFSGHVHACGAFMVLWSVSPPFWHLDRFVVSCGSVCYTAHTGCFITGTFKQKLGVHALPLCYEGIWGFVDGEMLSAILAFGGFLNSVWFNMSYYTTCIYKQGVLKLPHFTNLW